VQQRHALGVLFLVLAGVFALIAVASARAGEWVLAAAAGALGTWLLSLARAALRRR
jgi:hypothetical protein